MRQAILVLKALAYPGLPEVSLRHLDVSLYCNVVVCVLHMSVALRLHVHKTSCVFMKCAGGLTIQVWLLTYQELP